MDLPRIRKNLITGERVLEFRHPDGERHSVDLRCVLGLHEHDDKKHALLQVGGGCVATNHSYDLLADLLWPDSEEDF